MSPIVGFDQGANSGNLGRVSLGETKEVGAAVGGERGGGGSEGKDGDMSFVAELDHKVGLHRSSWP